MSGRTIAHHLLVELPGWGLFHDLLMWRREQQTRTYWDGERLVGREAWLQRNREKAAALRDVADWWERHPEYNIADDLDLLVPGGASWVDWPSHYYGSLSSITSGELRTLADECAAQPFLAGAARALAARAPVGSVRKERDETSADVFRTFGPFELRFYVTSAAHCDRVPTGEYKEQTVTEIPDEIKAQYTKTERVPIMRTVCPPLLTPIDVGDFIPGVDDEITIDEEVLHDVEPF